MLSFAEIQNKERSALYTTLNSLEKEKFFIKRLSSNANEIAVTQVKFLLEMARVSRRHLDSDIKYTSDDANSAAKILVIIERRSRELKKRADAEIFV